MGTINAHTKTTTANTMTTSGEGRIRNAIAQFQGELVLLKAYEREFVA